jgi:hypothetical protein
MIEPILKFNDCRGFKAKFLQAVISFGGLLGYGYRFWYARARPGQGLREVVVPRSVSIAKLLKAHDQKSLTGL